MRLLRKRHCMFIMISHNEKTSYTGNVGMEVWQMVLIQVHNIPKIRGFKIVALF
jgi:hypothetical protein